MSVTTQMATEKQVNFLRVLCTRRQVEAKWVDMVRAEIGKGIDKKRASMWIDWFQKQPEHEAPGGRGWSPVASIGAAVPATPVTPAKQVDITKVTPGIYVMPDMSLWRIQKAKGNATHYASLINLKNGRPTYLYTKGAIYKVAAEGKPVSVAVASKIGIDTGVCLICGADLTDEKSVKLGIGPVCLKKQTALHASTP